MSTYDAPDYIADDGTHYRPDAYEHDGVVYASVTYWTPGQAIEEHPVWVTCSNLDEAKVAADRLALLLSTGVVKVSAPSQRRVSYVYEVSA